jgi:RNA polymerase sigma factor (sigma-70 family)
VRGPNQAQCLRRRPGLPHPEGWDTGVPAGQLRLVPSADEPRVDTGNRRLPIQEERESPSGAPTDDWISFFDAEFQHVIGFLMKNGASLNDAQDAAGDAFAESWALTSRNPERWSQIANKRAWIRTVALRKLLRPPGSRIRPQEYSVADVPDTADAHADLEELTVQTQLVLQALATLDEEARSVVAFQLDGFSSAEIAQSLGVTDQRVRDISKKARRQLKRWLQPAAHPE